ncbi:MAG: DUF1830 domain-containing protein [Nodosilinea sp. WJT8-NPBG4]|jgi:hypothetical protein|nr:DUF1830 domain-containing protein [Nodosilinea sp. WJT8-NPBG4]
MITLKSVDKILCHYVNQTFQFQVIRISNIPHWFFERTIIPGDFVLFEAFKEAQLEVHTSAMVNSILSDIIPCEKLAQTND